MSRLGGSLALALVAVVAVSCSAFAGDDDGALADQLERRFEVAEREGRVADLRSTTDGDWDRLVFVCPHETEDMVAERLGFEWGEFPGEDVSEDRALFVFAGDDTVVNWTRLDRRYGDPCLGLPSSLPRAEALFDVEGDGDHLMLSPGEPGT